MRKRAGAIARLLVFVAFVVVVLPAKGRWLRGPLHGADGTVVYLIDHMIELVAVLAFGGIMAAIEKRPFAAYGLPWRQTLGARFWQGAAAGIVALAVLMVALSLAGAIEVHAPPAPTAGMVLFGLGYAVIFVLLAVREEFLYRGYGLFTLSGLTTFWFAAVASTAWFARTHAGPSESWVGLANVAIFGLLVCLALRRTGNLWMGLGYHAAWNWGQTYLFGVSDSGHPAPPGHLFTSIVSPSAPAWLSGGPVGPEGSVLCAGVLVLLWIACTRLLPGVRYPLAGETENASRG